MTGWEMILLHIAASSLNMSQWVVEPFQTHRHSCLNIFQQIENLPDGKYMGAGGRLGQGVEPGRQGVWVRVKEWCVCRALKFHRVPSAEDDKIQISTYPMSA